MEAEAQLAAELLNHDSLRASGMDDYEISPRKRKAHQELMAGDFP